MPTFHSDGVSLHYIDEQPERDVRDVILLIHGFASNVATNWVAPRWVETLTNAGYRVIAYDNRGHGQSEKLYGLEDYGAPLMAEDAKRLLDHLDLERVHVMGYSMGARISAFLGLAHPERMKRVIFGGLGINMVRGMSGTSAIAHALEAPSADDVTLPPARTFRLFAEQTKSDLRALAACIRSARAPISEEALAGFRVPALVAVGEADAVGGSAPELAALIPGAEAFVIPSRDHMKAVGDRAFKEKALSFLAADGL